MEEDPQRLNIFLLTASHLRHVLGRIYFAHHICHLPPGIRVVHRTCNHSPKHHPITMKINSGILMLFFLGNVWRTTAFTVRAPNLSSSVVLRSTPSDNRPELDMFPSDLPWRRIEGGNTVVTFPMPEGSERLQYFLYTNGRPMKAEVQLWLGPLRNTHTMEIDMMDGQKTPFRATLKFKQGAPALKISTKSDLEFPVMVAVVGASPERCDELAAITEEVWKRSPKTIVQGGSIGGGGGSVRTFPIPSNVNSVQVLFWAKDTGKKSLKAKIEVLQGPNCRKQVFDLQCGGGSQPYHAIIQTPGSGVTLRVYNKKFVEDGLFQIAVVPYDVTGHAEILSATTESTVPPGIVPGGHWWS